MRNCFTYLIGWSIYNKYYYGRKTSIGCHPSMLFESYFTSSIYVHEFIKKYGMPDIIQIRKVFGENYKDCETWESKVLKRLNVAADKRFLNKHNGTDFSTNNIAPAYDENQNFIGMVSCEDTQWGISIFGINKFKDISKFQNSGQEKMKDLAKNGKHPSQLRVINGTHHFQQNIGNRPGDIIQRKLVKEGNHYFQSSEHKTEVSKRTKKMAAEGKLPIGKKTICPYCNKVGQEAAMKRWHFDKCKINVSL